MSVIRIIQRSLCVCVLHDIYHNVVQISCCIDILFDNDRLRTGEVFNLQLILQVIKSSFDPPYADILEMPINLW